MEYNLLICTSTTKWIAIDINPNGELERISLDGNDFEEICSTEEVLEFCEKILGYYNINKFNDIQLNVKIVMVSKYSPLISELFGHIKDACSVNIIDAKTIMPIYVLKNYPVKANRKIGIHCMGENFSFRVDDELTVSYESAGDGEELRIEPESFSVAFSFNCQNLISDERKYKALEKKYIEETEKQKQEITEKADEISVLNNKYSNIKSELETLEKQFISATCKIEKTEAMLKDQRSIIYFDKNSIAYLPSSLFGLSATIHPQKKYKCTLCKTDGEVIKKGQPIIEFDLEDYNNPGIVKSKFKGKIHYLVWKGDSISLNDAVAIISDPMDEKEDVLNWYRSIKLGEKDE